MPHWRLYGHAGALRALNGPSEPYAARTRFDLRLGVAREFTHGEVHVAWTRTEGAYDYPTGVRQGRDALVVGLAYYF